MVVPVLANLDSKSRPSCDTQSNFRPSCDTESNLRIQLKIVRDPSKTAWDMLPSGITVGEFANAHAVDSYIRKVDSKRMRARQKRAEQG